MALSFSLVNLLALFDKSDCSGVEMERKSIADVTNLPSLILLNVTTGLPSVTDLQIASSPYMPEKKTKYLLDRVVDNCKHFVLKLLHIVALLLSFRLKTNFYKTDCYQLLLLLNENWLNGRNKKVYEFGKSALN